MQELPTTTVHDNEMAGLTAGMSGMRIASKSGVQEEALDNSDLMAKPVEKNEERKNLTEHRSVKGKGKDVLRQQDVEEEADTFQGMASLASSSALSAGTVATRNLAEPYQPGDLSQSAAAAITTNVSKTFTYYPTTNIAQSLVWSATTSQTMACSLVKTLPPAHASCTKLPCSPTSCKQQLPGAHGSLPRAR
jgi:hypothetical protein